ncbi:hypothetical protein [Salininema proteolyticum]|uniref:Thiosulfate dehydrogenase [quinone] large subunit n=1 Tax=Salininema proteolyticum TaxID=1607685 RepID=A0ABV8U1I0_9ACTN
MNDSLEHSPPTEATAEAPAAGRRTLALLRIVLSGVFLWAAADHLLGLGRPTPSGQGWVDGQSPTSGYLAGAQGTFADLFQGLSGQAWVDVLFVGGMGAVGVALLLGIGMRLAAVGAVCLMGMLYLSSMPLQGNPVVDQHLVYLVAAVALAASGAGRAFGLGARWERTGLVKAMPWLR